MSNNCEHDSFALPIYFFSENIQNLIDNYIDKYLVGNHTACFPTEIFAGANTIKM